MSKSIILFSVLLSVRLGLLAQSPEVYGNTITASDLQKHLAIVASAEMEGRETATEGQRKAAAYIAAEFKKMGLQMPVATDQYQQFYPVMYDTIATAALTINNVPYTYGNDFYTSWQSFLSDDIKAGRLVFVGYGISDSNYNDYRGKNVRGKVAIMFTGEPKKGNLYLISNTKLASKWTYPGTKIKADEAFTRGAKAVIMISPAQTTMKAENISRRSSLYYPGETDDDHLNVAVISHDLAAAILGKDNFDELLKKAKNNEPLRKEKLKRKMPVSFTMAVEKKELKSSNVIGYIEGNDKKDENVMLTAHYDHLGVRGGNIYFGADDDGSGTVSVLEMAEAFAKAKAAGNGPRRTIVFMTVSGEEKGLWGSQYYTDHPLFPLAKTSINLNTDMVGRIDPKRKEGDSTNYLYVIGDDKLSSELMPLQDDVNTKYSRLELDRRYNANDPSRYYYRSDHYNFARKGVPIIFYFNGTHADYHRPSDTVDKINFALMEKRVRLIFYTAWTVANRDEMMKRDKALP